MRSPWVICKSLLSIRFMDNYRTSPKLTSMGRALLRISSEGLPFATRTLRLRPRGRRLLFRYARFWRGSDLNGLDLTTTKHFGL